MLDQHESHYAGWNVKHFHEHLQLSRGQPWSYSWVKTKLQDGNLCRGGACAPPRIGASESASRARA